MTRTSVERLIAADPASVALLLAGPVTPPDDAADVPGAPDAATVGPDLGRGLEILVSPPVRSALWFSAGIEVRRGGLLLATGLLTLGYAAGEPVATRARLVLDDLTGTGFLREAHAWLDRLTAAAQARACAA